MEHTWCKSINAKTQTAKRKKALHMTTAVLLFLHRGTVSVYDIGFVSAACSPLLKLLQINIPVTLIVINNRKVHFYKLHFSCIDPKTGTEFQSHLLLSSGFSPCGGEGWGLWADRDNPPSPKRLCSNTNRRPQHNWLIQVWLRLIYVCNTRKA